MLKGPYDFTMPGTIGGGPNNVVPLSAAVNSQARSGPGPLQPSARG